MARALREEFRVEVRWVEGESENTAENALFSAAILRRDNVQRVLLVSDAMHMPRAQMSFRSSGIEVVPAPTMFFRMTTYRVYDFMPRVEGLRRSHYALYEWIGLLWYGIRSVV